MIAKVLFGLAGGIVPNLKGYIRYVTDDTNISNLYVYLTLCLTFCAIIGPVITSFFMNPKRKFGGVWDN